MIGVVITTSPVVGAGRVAGMLIPLRHALLLQSVGCERVVVSGVEAQVWAALFGADDRVRVPCEDAPDVRARPCVVLSDRVVVDVATLRALCARSSHVALGGEVVAFFSGDTRGESDPITPSLCLPVCDPAERAVATRALLEALRKPQDGIVSRALNRRISLAITALLCRTNLRPNQLSVAILAFGVAAAWCASRGTPAQLALAGLLFQAQSVLDGCDGELARLTFRGSRLGEWVDTLGDDLTNYAYFGAAAIGLHRAGLGAPPLALGAVGVGAGLIASAIEYVYLARIGSGDLLRYPIGFGRDAGASDESLREATGLRALAGALRPLFKRDFFVFAAMLCAFAGLRATLVMLALFAVGAVTTLLAVLRSEWARRGIPAGREP